MIHCLHNTEWGWFLSESRITYKVNKFASIRIREFTYQPKAVPYGEPEFVKGIKKESFQGEEKKTKYCRSMHFIISWGGAIVYLGVDV